MTEEGRKRINRTVWAISAFASILALAVIFNSQRESRPVVVFPAVGGDRVMVPAATGDLGTVELRYTKVRDCRMLPQFNSLTLRDQTGGFFKINQRSGIPGNIVMGPGNTTIDFEVPRLAKPGPASVIIYGAFSCPALGRGSRSVPYQSNPIPFQVLGES